ncbi:DNA-directed_RNA polymerase subunit beta [Hexamita inflata]|uniref:DNA-directed RNA polymerase n=1 Tax=Hexamita inflata TaxID=28002 RepID=A0AA86P1M9_9EUKA|nr:DNA-directed RNA polymerase subunit beta [Hexamita inflata]
MSTIPDQWKLVTEYVNQRGIVSHHLQSFNSFVDNTVKEIVRANCEVRSSQNPSYFLRFDSVDVKRPCVLNEGARELTPQECRLRKISYSAPIMAKIQLRVSKDDPIQRAEVRIGNLPIMLRSNRCVLNGLTEMQQVQLDEDYYDPGGYFIVNGTEKVVLMVEQTTANRIIIVKNEEQIEATVTSDTHERKSRCQVILKNKKLYLLHNTFGKNWINVVVLYKAMGITSDQQILQYIGNNGIYQEYLTQTIYEANELNIFTQKQALAYLSKQFAPRSFKLKKSLMQEALDCLATVILCHIPVIVKAEAPSKTNIEEKQVEAENQQQPKIQQPQTVYNFKQKVIFLSEMIRRVILTQSGLQLNNCFSKYAVEDQLS